MSCQPPHRCHDCGALLSKHYPYDYCPRCWQNRYNAPPGKCRIDNFEAAANLARESPLCTPRLTTSSSGSTIAASKE